MTILLYTISIIITFSGIFYIVQHKKKLSPENIVEFEKTIKPKILRFIFLSIIPLLLISYYLMNDLTEINGYYFIYAGLTTVVISLIGYIQSKKIIESSTNSENFKYVLNYFIFSCMAMLFVLYAIAYSLKDYLTY